MTVHTGVEFADGKRNKNRYDHPAVCVSSISLFDGSLIT